MITPETLEKFIEENSTAKIIETLQAMSEEERAGLRATAIKEVEIFRFREIQARPTKHAYYPIEHGTAQKTPNDTTVDPAFQRAREWFESAKVVMLYCCDYSEIKAAGQNALPGPDAALKVLSHRRPTWLDKWCAYIQTTWPSEYWHTMLEVEKLVPKKLKHTLAYYQALALGLPSLDDMEKYIENSERLKEEFYTFVVSPTTIRAMAAPQAVAREIYNSNMLHFKSFAFQPRANMDEHPKRWIKCITNLAEQETLDKQRLIEVSFQALANAAEAPTKRKSSYTPHEPIAQFLCSLNDALCTDKTLFLTKYSPLVGAENSDVSVYAMTIFLNTSPDLLPVGDILANIPMAFRNRDKAPATAALKLLAKLATTPDIEQEALGLAITDAFNHKSKAIHKDAIKLIETYGLANEEAVANKLGLYLDLLEGINKIAASKLLKTHLPSTPSSEDIDQSQPPGKDSDCKVQEQLQPLQVDLESLNETYRNLAGIPPLIDVSKQVSPPALVDAILAPADLVSMESPRLYAAETVKPITDLDDLIFLASAAMTSSISAEKAELLLDGIARLWKEKPADFDQKLETIYASMKDPNGVWFDQGASPLGMVKRIWLQGKNATSIRFRLRPSLLSARCAGLASRICCGVVLPQLAAPTHKGGWVDPVILTKRIADYQKQGRLLKISGDTSAWDKSSAFIDWLTKPANNGYQADAPDFIQALLRLAPDGRAVALSEAQAIKGDFGKALRYALGDGDLESIKPPELALAAFRSRYPKGTCLSLSKWIQPDLPDGIYPAVYSSGPSSMRSDGTTSFSRNLTGFLKAAVADSSLTAPDVPSDKFQSSAVRPETYDSAMQNLLCPTIRMHRYISDQQLHDEACIMWLQNKEPYLARMARTTLENMDSTASHWQVDYDILFDPDFPLYENGSWWLAVSLAARHDELRRLALDILIASVEEQRADAKALGHVMASLNKMPIQRWNKALRELGRVSSLHAHFSWQVLLSYLSDKKQETSLNTLELLLELKEECGFGLSSDAINALGQFAGTGKGAKIAKSLASAGEKWTNLATLQEAAEQSLNSRIARVERWQRSQYFNVAAAPPSQSHKESLKDLSKRTGLFQFWKFFK